MVPSHSIIKALLKTEKSTYLYEPESKYLFLVDKSSSKLEIKRAVEEIYKVRVRDVNTAILPGKLKRVRFQAGRTPDFKKAVVSLKEGEKIEVA